MRIKKLYPYRLRNYAHSQFCEDVRSLVVMEGAEKLKIAGLFETWSRLYEREDAALSKIVKSVYTAQIWDTDKARDDIYRGMVKINAGNLKHYNPEIREAAANLSILFGTYGDVPRRQLDAQTAAVTNILQELRGDYAGHAALVGLSGWVEELDARNNTFKDLTHKRFKEAAERVSIVLSEARAEVDAAYFAICEQINALVVVEGVAAYENFIKCLNVIIARYALMYKPKGRKISNLPPCS